MLKSSLTIADSNLEYGFYLDNSIKLQLVGLNFKNIMREEYKFGRFLRRLVSLKTRNWLWDGTTKTI